MSTPIWIALASAISGLVSVATGAYVSSRVTLQRVRALQGRFIQEITRVRVGAILCDYANLHDLNSLATQYNVPPLPEELERKYTRKATRQAEYSAGGGKLGVSGESGEEATLLYRPQLDLNILTEKVIDVMGAKEKVKTNLTALPAITFAEIEKVAGSNGELTVQMLRDELIGAHMKTRLLDAFKEKQYVLIDANWLVTSRDGCAILKLTQTADADAEFHPAISLEVEVPIQATSEFEVALPRCRRFKKGREVTASVFGTCTSHSPEKLEFSVTPVVVFERLGKGS